mgnify:FL=1
MSSEYGSIFKAILLGALQGLTEFLPVSSSGHLVLLHHLLDYGKSTVFFDVMLHAGTLGAILVVYRKSIYSLAKLSILDTIKLQLSDAQRTVGLLVLATIPIGIIGLLFHRRLEQFFAKPKAVAIMLVVTAILLQLPRFREFSQPPTSQNQNSHQSMDRRLRIWQALLIGLVQGFAVIPGISRSGATISVALLLGIQPAVAAEFSFLLSIPAILGAVVLKLGDIATVNHLTAVGVGMITAFIVGVVALQLLLTLINRGRFSIFSYYCLLIAALAFLL